MRGSSRVSSSTIVTGSTPRAVRPYSNGLWTGPPPNPDHPPNVGAGPSSESHPPASSSIPHDLYHPQFVPESGGAINVITLTDNAALKVRELIDQEGDERLALRVAVRPGGCSGFSYEMFFDSETAADDVAQEYGSIKVLVDPSSAQLLTGATLDYKDGAQEEGFHIDNPNAQHTCGCGNSSS
ncbi:MAG: iron-sulfur cluster insertion protein ErpA [Actinomycetia bacterium]|nr:iron-sulfur cluster insertion protein ErpA [Actinomycetes bacterium]